ncbi:glycosyltransferase family 2 protein [soil metagenome]
MIDVIFPVLDEAGALPWLLGRMPAGHRAIVVDNGSTDGSAGIAAEHGADVVTAPRRGFGSACWAGLGHATADVVAFCDADASLDPLDLPKVTGPVVAGDADLVLGARQASTAGAFPAHARAANRYLARRIRRSTGVALTDLGPMRAVRRAELLALGMQDRRFGWPLEMVLRGAAAGWRITEIPVPYHPRIGRSKVSGSLTGSARAVRDMRAVLADLS